MDFGFVPLNLVFSRAISAESAVCPAAYYQLLQLSLLIHSLSSEAATLLVQAFITTCLDYCNSLLYGISDNLYRRLQAIQNAAACLITNTRRCKHVSPVLQQLHWLPAFQSTIVFNSRSPCWCTRHCTTYCLRTWWKTANLCLSLDTDDCVRRTPTRG